MYRPGAGTVSYRYRIAGTGPLPNQCAKRYRAGTGSVLAVKIYLPLPPVPNVTKPVPAQYRHVYWVGRKWRI